MMEPLHNSSAPDFDSGSGGAAPPGSARFSIGK